MCKEWLTLIQNPSHLKLGTHPVLTKYELGNRFTWGLRSGNQAFSNPASRQQTFSEGSEVELKEKLFGFNGHNKDDWLDPHQTGSLLKSWTELINIIGEILVLLFSTKRLCVTPDTQECFLITSSIEPFERSFDASPLTFGASVLHNYIPEFVILSAETFYRQDFEIHTDTDWNVGNFHQAKIQHTRLCKIYWKLIKSTDWLVWLRGYQCFGGHFPIDFKNPSFDYIKLKSMVLPTDKANKFFASFLQLAFNSVYLGFVVREHTTVLMRNVQHWQLTRDDHCTLPTWIELSDQSRRMFLEVFEPTSPHYFFTLEMQNSQVFLFDIFMYI
jgi:hypothetical protein